MGAAIYGTRQRDTRGRPAHTSRATSAGQPRLALPSKPPRWTVLVVDDEPPVLRMVQDVLEDEGFSVVTAREGREALTIVERIQPDLILTDLMMPQMSGRALCWQVRRDPRTAHIPVLLMSAAYQPQPGDEFSAVIPKPFDIDDLLGQIQRHMVA